MKWISLLLITLCLSSCGSIKEPDTPTANLKEMFQNPPVDARPKALWTWLNGNVDTSMLRFEMKEARDKGLGGFDIWDVGMIVDPHHVVPDGPPFMGDSSLMAIQHALALGSKYDMEMGLTIASSWNAGGSWIPEEHGVMGLFRSSVVIDQGEKDSIKVPTPHMEPYILRGNGGRRDRMLDFQEDGLPSFRKDVALLAFPLRNDSLIQPDEVLNLSAYLDQTHLQWQARPGKWLLTRYTCMPTGQPLAIPGTNSKGLMIDHFSAEATRYHMNYFFEKLGTSLSTDALKYFYNDSYEANSAAWTPSLPLDFKNLRGYEITPLLPALDGFQIENSDYTERFLHDFRKTLSDLIINNHYQLGSELCHEQGIGYVAEAGGPGPPVHNVPFEDLKALGQLDIPRGEFWYRHPRGQHHMDELQIVKGIASAAHIYNKKYVEAESFTSVWLWQEGPMDLKPVADKAFCEGLNRIVYHTFPHIPESAGHPGWIYNFGTVMNTHRAWWPKSRAWNDYLARISYIMQQGHFVADVAYYYGDAAPNFVGHKKTFEWLGEGYDYDVVNTDVLLHKMKSQDGRIILPHGQSYRLLVVKPSPAINLDALKKIQKLVEEGATIICQPPSKVYGLNNFQEKEDSLRTIISQLWGDDYPSPRGTHTFGKGSMIWGYSAKEVLQQRGIFRDFSYAAPNNPPMKLEYIHRATDSYDFYFVRNVDSLPREGQVTFRSTGHPTLWDPVTGRITDIPIYQQSDVRTTIPITWAPHGAYIFAFEKAKTTLHITSITAASGPDSQLSIHLIPGADEMMVNLQGDAEYLFRYSDGDERVFYSKKDLEIPLTNPWKVTFEEGWDAPDQIEMGKLTSLHFHSDQGIRTYAGIIQYETGFTLAENPDTSRAWFLDLGEVNEVADVVINGDTLATGSFYPFLYDISESVRKENTLVVSVATLLNNRLVGDGRKKPEDRRTRSNIDKLPSPWATPMGKAPLKPSGLVGPVRVIAKSVFHPTSDIKK